MTRRLAPLVGHSPLFQTLFDSAPAGIFIGTLEGALLEANPAYCEILGRPRDEVVGGGLLQFTHPQDREPTRRRLQEVVQGKVQFEKRYVRKDGEVRWALSTGTAFTPGDRGETYVVGHVIDISPLKSMEASLQKLTAELLKLQDSEQRRLAILLHETAGQTLAALSLNVEKLRRHASALPPGAMQSLVEITELTRSAAGEVRTLSHLMLPPALDEFGLDPALEWLAQGFAQRSGIDVRLSVRLDDARLDPELEHALFRFVQECLTNIHRHAGSTTAAIVLEKMGDRIFLEVRDEGRGIPAELVDERGQPTAKVGVGLGGIRERVRSLGGSLEIRRADPGTLVEIMLPARSPIP